MRHTKERRLKVYEEHIRPKYLAFIISIIPVFTCILILGLYCVE